MIAKVKKDLDTMFEAGNMETQHVETQHVETHQTFGDKDDPQDSINCGEGEHETMKYSEQDEDVIPTQREEVDPRHNQHQMQSSSQKQKKRVHGFAVDSQFEDS